MPDGFVVSSIKKSKIIISQSFWIPNTDELGFEIDECWLYFHPLRYSTSLIEWKIMLQMQCGYGIQFERINNKWRKWNTLLIDSGHLSSNQTRWIRFQWHISSGIILDGELACGGLYWSQRRRECLNDAAKYRNWMRCGSLSSSGCGCRRVPLSWMSFKMFVCLCRVPCGSLLLIDCVGILRAK